MTLVLACHGNLGRSFPLRWTAHLSKEFGTFQRGASDLARQQSTFNPAQHLAGRVGRRLPEHPDRSP